MDVYRLAPMTTSLRLLTWALFGLPATFAYFATAAPPPVSWVLQATTLLLVLTYGSVWLAWRPSRFEVDATTLRIRWPVRSRTILRRDVVSARIVESADFRADYGYGMRVGAGGLWGAFGLLKTRRETFSMWISRTDRFVIVELRAARPLLLTPEDPERFVRALRDAAHA